VEDENMSVILSKKQMASYANALREQQDAPIQPKVCLVADSPNLTRSVERTYGKGVRPDLATVLNIGRQYGQVHEATIVANPGLPRHVASRFERLGYVVDRGLGLDCDDRVISKCVQAGLVADTLICIGGDHCMVDVIRLVKLQRRSVRVIVIGVRGTTAACLKEACDEFINLPVLSNAVAA
jgi:hypothetical protein